MSLSKPNTVDRYIFAIALPFSNLPVKYPRWLTWAIIIIYRLVLCGLPCILYMLYIKKLMNKHMLRYVKIGAFCCFSYIALLTYVCYRSDYIHKHFPPMFWIFVVLTLLFFIMAILLATYTSSSLSESNVKDISDAFQGILGITKQNPEQYEGDATTIEGIEKNLKAIQDSLLNKKDITEDMSEELKEIYDLADSVQKNLQDQLDELNQELKNNPERQEEISQAADILNDNVENLTTYYEQLQPYRDRNKGKIFIFIMCMLFLLISTVAFFCDFFTTCNYSN